jgi:hypothetical protein
LGGGSDESEVYLADMAQMLIAESDEMEVRMFESAAYHDGTAVRSAVSRDETVMRLIARHDFAPRYRGADIAVVTGVQWDVLTP